MEKQVLLELFQVAKKAVEAGNEDRCLDALSRLKVFPITDLHILASTLVPKGVFSLTAHSSKKIQRLARDIIINWKLLLYNQRKPFKKPSPMAHHVQIPIPTVNSIPKTRNSTRDKIRQQIFEALVLVFTEAKNRAIRKYDPVKVAVAVESALFMGWGLSNNGFRNKYRSFLFNIKDSKNPDFRRKILVGEIKAEEVAKLNALEMARDKRKQENEEIKERFLNKRLIQRNKEDEKATNDKFKCGKCGKRQTTYNQLQTRSADEPMTTYVTCMNCDHRWKFC